MWFVFLFCICFVSSNDGSADPQTSSLLINNFIRKLQLENWTKEEAPCLENTLKFLENVKNSTLWATWVWNANMLPTGNLFGASGSFGNFDQCMKPPWLATHSQYRTKYCLAQFTLTDTLKTVTQVNPYDPTEDFIKSKTTMGNSASRLQWGVCVPAACQPPSVKKIIRTMYDITYFGDIRPNITVDYCQLAGEKAEFTTGFYLFWSLIALLVITVGVSTFYGSRINNDDQNSNSSVILKSFCMVQNYQNLIKENQQEIRVMKGIRFITAFHIVILHASFFKMIAGIINIRDIEEDSVGVTGLFWHLDIIVDTFFAMSGLLHMKGLLANSNKHQNLFMVLWKRYVRLIGPLALVIFYMAAVSDYTGSGPIWQKYIDIESGVCRKNWPLSILMMNSDMQDVCPAATWYVSTDYQLTILVTIVFYFYRKDRRIGFAVFGTAAVLSLIIPAALTYFYQLPAIHFLDFNKIIYEPRKCMEIRYTYSASHSRGGAYLVGVAMGYLMTLYKPADFRKTISKTWSIVGTVMCLVVMVYLLALGQFYIGREYYPLEAAIAAATNRVVWAVAVCCIIGFCEYGTVPLVTDFLGLPIFTPLSRLSYNIYLIHTIVINRNLFSLRTQWKYDMFYTFTETMGTLVITLVLSLVMWLLAEAPMINFANQLFSAKRNEKSKYAEKNGVKHQNGNAKAKNL